MQFSLPPQVPLPQLEALVKQSFAMRRKTIRNNLKGMISAKHIEQVGIDPSQRPETISVSQFEQLTLQYIDNKN